MSTMASGPGGFFGFAAGSVGLPLLPGLAGSCAKVRLRSVKRQVKPNRRRNMMDLCFVTASGPLAGRQASCLRHGKQETAPTRIEPLAGAEVSRRLGRLLLLFHPGGPARHRFLLLLPAAARPRAKVFLIVAQAAQSHAGSPHPKIFAVAHVVAEVRDH